MGLFGLFKPRITQDQGAEALAAFLVLSAAQGAEDYLNSELLTISNTDIVTPDRAHQTVLKKIIMVREPLSPNVT